MAIDMNALRAKALKKNEEDRKKFLPLDLNEGNVQAIFNRCLATKDDDRDKLYGSVLFQRDLGYDEDSKPVYFSKGRLEQNRKNILYLLGQLKTVHENDLKLTSATAIDRYDGVKWTIDTVKLMELFHLGEATHAIQPFTKQSNTAHIARLLVTPTLSPKDPSFPAWWAEHKAEWEA